MKSDTYHEVYNFCSKWEISFNHLAMTDTKTFIQFTVRVQIRAQI